MANGVLIIDKPQGWTSMDVCAKLRGIFHEKRVGHAGTLDPMATGVLPVFLGRATRAVEFASEGAKEYHAVLRLGTGGESARQLYRGLPWLRDAAFAAGRLCARMAASGERLEQLSSKTPRFSSWKREVPLSRDRGEIMRELAAQAGKDARMGEGLRLRSRGGWVYLVPLARRAAVRIVAEGPDLEMAAELCDFYAGQVAKLDRTPKEQTK